ncbi:MAG: hypothetical protein IJT19_09915 [Bacteroidaceae bacterium]|nr:hypothetical protein [Bacteroidaceae bacterium]
MKKIYQAPESFVVEAETTDMMATSVLDSVMEGEDIVVGLGGEIGSEEFNVRDGEALDIWSF